MVDIWLHIPAAVSHCLFIKCHTNQESLLGNSGATRLNVCRTGCYLYVIDCDYGLFGNIFLTANIFRNWLDPSSELRMRHKINSRSTTASRRVVEEGGTPHPGWWLYWWRWLLSPLSSSNVAPLLGVSHPPSRSCGSCWLCGPSVSTGGSPWVTPSSLPWYTLPLPVVSNPSYALSVSSQTFSQCLLCIPWDNLCMGLSKLLLRNAGQIFCPWDGPRLVINLYTCLCSSRVYNRMCIDCFVKTNTVQGSN